jgi:hypothetical protein
MNNQEPENGNLPSEQSEESEQPQAEQLQPEIPSSGPEDLGTLSLGEKKLLLLTLPSTATSVIVGYGGEVLCVSCMFPKETRIIKARDKHNDDEDSDDAYDETHFYPVTVNCPPLLYTMEYADFPIYGRAGSLVVDSYLFAFNPLITKKVAAVPYMISNVYSSGQVCFGDHRPASPREGFNTFWNTPFNPELQGEAPDSGLLDRGAEDLYYEDEIDEYIEKYHKLLQKQAWQDMTEHVCSSKYWAAPHGAEAILISNREDLLRQIPEKYWRRRPAEWHNIPFVIALGNREEDHWVFNSGTYTFKLKQDAISCVENTNSEVASLKERFAQ